MLKTPIRMMWSGRAARQMEWRGSAAADALKARQSPKDYLFAAMKCSTSRGAEGRYPDRFVSWKDFGSTAPMSGKSSRTSTRWAGGRRGHLRHGLLRQLHARRVAGECGR